jgi:hypothetical protein
MYHVLTQVLFWLYWLITLMGVGLIVRELFRTSRWTAQVTTVLALIPLLLRILLLK